MSFKYFSNVMAALIIIKAELKHKHENPGSRLNEE